MRRLMPRHPVLGRSLIVETALPCCACAALFMTHRSSTTTTNIKHPNKRLSASSDGVTAANPATWPIRWEAADIKSFLAPKLKAGAKVNFVVLAVCLKQRDFDSLKFNYLHQLAPPKNLSVHDCLVGMSQTMFQSPGFLLITSEENWGMMSRRSSNIDSDSYVRRSGAPVATQHVLCMVTCESGGGKTVDAVASVSLNGNGTRCIVFYFIAADIDAGLDSGTIMDTNARNTIVVDNLVSAMKAVFKNKGHPGFLDTLRKTKEPLALGIVIDEAGERPDVVRALCAVVPDLRSRLGLPASVTLLVAAAGTGVGCGSVPPGSLPTTYNLHHVTTGEHVWKALTRASGGRPNPLVEPIEKHARGSLVIKNPRFARLLYGEIEEAVTVTNGLPFGATAVLVESCLVKSAIKFKSINGLSSLKGTELLDVMGAAVAAIQTYITPPPTIKPVSGSHGVIHEELLKFIATYGMVVDNAVWSTSAQNMDVWGSSKNGPNVPTTSYLVSPPGKRYTLSVSQSAIFLLLLGLVPARSDLSGETLESAVATLFPLLISAYRERKVGDMLSVFGGACTNDAFRYSNRLDTQMQTASSLHVRTVRYSRSGQGVLQGGVKQTTQACVFVNGPKYPFADIVVAIPNAALILVQCKDYSTKLTKAAILEEMHKMGHPKGKAPRIKYRTVEKSKRQLVAEQQAQFKHKQRQVRSLAKSYKVPLNKITYLFVEAKTHDSGYDGQDNVTFGAISNLPMPLAEMLPFNAEKVAVSTTVNEVGCLPDKLFHRRYPPTGKAKIFSAKNKTP